MNLIETVALDDREKAELIGRAVHAQAYRMAGNRVRILGNARAPIDTFSQMYSWFVAEPAGAEGSDGEVRLYFDLQTAAGGHMTLLSGDQVYRVRDPEVIQWCFGIMTYLLLQRFVSHYFIHAGCVARNGKGIVISGESGMGKTTLVAHLVSRGMAFLSDELAPIARGTAMVEPFPRRLCIRPGAGDRLITEDMEAIAFATRDDRRRMVAAEALTGKAVSPRVPVHSVVFLTTRPEGPVTTPMKFNRVIRVSFTETTGALEAGLRALPGVTITRADRDLEFPAFTLETLDPPALLPALRALSVQHQVEISELAYENLEAPDHAAEPRLVQLPAAAGVIELIKKMPGSMKNHLVTDVFGGQFTKLVEEVAATVKQVRFYRLSPGRLEAMLHTVETLPE